MAEKSKRTRSPVARCAMRAASSPATSPGTRRRGTTRNRARRPAVAQRCCIACDVERPMVPADAPGEERRALRAREQQVAVVARASRRSARGIRRHRLRPEHATASAAGCALTPRTHAVSGRCASVSKCTICTSRARRRRCGRRRRCRPRCAGDLAERALERVLHAAARRLRLPAAERAAGVFEPSAMRMAASEIRASRTGKMQRAAD